MKYPVNVYSKALAEAISAPGVEANKIALNFFAVLRRNGDEAHAEKIVEGAARLSRGREGLRKITIESARPLTPAQRKTLQPFIKAGDVVSESVIPELVSGVRIFVDDEKLFDGSLKKKLDTIFKI